jgi:hypothetical protein
VHKAFHIANNPLPAGYRIFFEIAEIRGVHLRRGAARAFCRARSPRLSWQREPRNRHDPNAIAVFGTWAGWFGRKSRQLGYVDRELAAILADADLSTVLPRLHKTYVGRGGFVEITFQVIGPSELFEDYWRPTSSFEAAEALRKAGDKGEAERALIFEIARTEIEDRKNGLGVAPAPYLALAKLYRAEKRFQDEVSILERYEGQRKARGVLPLQLSQRLIKARKLAARKTL